MSRELESIGGWSPGSERPAFSQLELLQAVARFREAVSVVQERSNRRVGVAFGGTMVSNDSSDATHALLASLPAVFPEWLGDRSFCEIHRLRFPYVAGAMANGISSTDMVIAMARAGCLGFFGAAGLEPTQVETAIVELEQALGSSSLPFGANLIHSPHEPELEEAVANLYLRRGVRRVSASAFMQLTPPVVRYACQGLQQTAAGTVHRQNHLFAKISRPEVARRFMEPPPAPLVRALVEQGKLSEEEGRLAALLPVAEEVTVEADSGGHTDNQSLSALFPTIQGLRDEIVQRCGYRRGIRLGAAGGLGTPAAVAAAFGLGAAYVLTGSVNQACGESGLAADARHLLHEAELADVVMAPAADMFELGVEVQVLKRATMFSVRARRLYDLYRRHESLEELSDSEVERLEREVFRTSLHQAWQETREYWKQRDPREVEKAESNPRHLMALLFRSYLGQSSHWALHGVEERRTDYQIWCGPAMGAFNAWTAGSFLADPEQRTVTQVALNLLEGAAVVTRAQQLRSCGVPMPAAAFSFRPRPLAPATTTKMTERH